MSPTELTSNLFFLPVNEFSTYYCTDSLHTITVFTKRLSGGNMTKHINMTYYNAGCFILQRAAENFRNQLIGLII